MYYRYYMYTKNLQEHVLLVLYVHYKLVGACTTGTICTLKTCRSMYYRYYMYTINLQEHILQEQYVHYKLAGACTTGTTCTL